MQTQTYYDQLWGGLTNALGDLLPIPKSQRYDANVKPKNNLRVENSF